MYTIDNKYIDNVLISLNSLKKQIEITINFLSELTNGVHEIEVVKEYEDPDEYLKSWSSSL